MLLRLVVLIFFCWQLFEFRLLCLAWCVLFRSDRLIWPSLIFRRGFLGFERCFNCNQGTPCPTWSFVRHGRHLSNFDGRRRMLDTPNFLLWRLSLRIHLDLMMMNGLMVICCLWHGWSIAEFGQAFQAEKHIRSWSYIFSYLSLAVNLVLGQLHLAISTPFIVEKVFWEITSRNWWRLPPFILSRDNTIAHAFCRHLIGKGACSNHGFAALVARTTKIVDATGYRVVARWKPWYRAAWLDFNQHIFLFLLSYGNIQMLALFGDKDLIVLLFWCNSITVLRNHHHSGFLQVSLATLLMQVGVALLVEGHDSTVWLWWDTRRLCLLEAGDLWFNRESEPCFRHWMLLLLLIAWHIICNSVRFHNNPSLTSILLIYISWHSNNLMIYYISQ